MIKIVAKNIIKEDKVNEFIALAKKLVEETNKNDAGCSSYELFQDLKDPKILTIIEEWENTDLLSKHTTSKHFKEITPTFAALSEKPGEINVYQKIL